jgi:hypothetical protein
MSSAEGIVARGLAVTAMALGSDQLTMTSSGKQNPSRSTAHGVSVLKLA